MKRKLSVFTIMFLMLLSGCAFLTPSTSVNYFDENLKLISFDGIEKEDSNTNSLVKRKNNKLEEENGVTIVNDAYNRVEATVMNKKRDSFVDMVIYLSYSDKMVVFNEGNGDYQCSTTTEFEDDMWVTKIVLDLVLEFDNEASCYVEIKEINFLRDGSDKKKAQIDGKEVSQVNFGFVLPENGVFNYNGFRINSSDSRAIYKYDENGNPVCDENGNIIILSFEVFEGVIYDSYLENTGKDVHIPGKIIDYYGNELNIEMIDRIFGIWLSEIFVNNDGGYLDLEDSIENGYTFLPKQIDDIDLYIPNTIKYVNDLYFVMVFNCTNVYYEGSIEDYLKIASLNGGRFETLCHGDVYFLDENNEYYSISEYNVTSDKDVNSLNFSGIKSLEKVTFNNEVTCIGNSAFEYCTNLKSVELSNSITTIKDAAFYNCVSLDYIVIPSSVTTIGAGAFFREILESESTFCIYLEHESIPEGFYKKEYDDDRSWNTYYSHAEFDGVDYYTSLKEYKYYLANEWKYVNGIPTPIK